MALTASIMNNKRNGTVSLFFNANVANIVMTGNDSVSNVALSNESIVSAPINQAWAGSPSGNAAYWEVKRGANTVLVIDSTCYLDFAGNGGQLKRDEAAANLSVTLVGATAGFLILEFQKLGAGGRPPLGANSDYHVAGQ